MKDDEQQPNTKALKIEEDVPGALRAKMGEGQDKKPESAASMDPTGAHELDFVAEKAQAAIDPFHPSFEALPVLLQHLSVSDLVAWRVTSRHTRSPEVLTRHVAELGRFDTSASMVAFRDAVHRLESPPHLSKSEAFGDDVGSLKIFECQEWCIALGQADRTHFAESVVRAVVVKNLDFALGYCLDQDMSVRKAAHTVVRNYIWGGLDFVKEPVAEAMLSQMRDMTSASRSQMPPTWASLKLCMQHLEDLLRSLTRPQRQEWASCLVTALQSFQPTSVPEVSRTKCQTWMLQQLKLLWLADDDPLRTYADTKRQLEALRKSPNFQDVRQNIHCLVVC
ncbi:unnamed protein product [Symbiodinium sp. CCMP2592]|nr:unnamed protein product [Symbiodinium sp. CCMP2592]